MFPTHVAQQQAIAEQLVEMLAAYRAGMDALVAGRCDPLQCEHLGDQFDDMRKLAAALPRVQVTWVELLISRFEFTEALRHGRRPGQVTVRLVELHARHRGLVDELSRKCLQYYARRA